MKWLILIISLTFGSLACSSQDDADTVITNGNPPSGGGVDKNPDPDAEYAILFIGNSLTYTNNLPTLVESLAADNGVAVSTTMEAKPNYAIVDHWQDGAVQRLIRSGQYDFVVIQQGPSSQNDGYEMLVNDGKQYARLCEQYNAKLAYFMVWPSRAYYHTFNGVITNYTLGAEANNAILCPVGQVWKDHFDRTNDFSYYGPDQFHPSLEGSRVAAKVILSSLGIL